jgi:hypothetical protein
LRDFDRLRKDITKLERDIARSPDAKPDGGNNHKRIRLHIRARNQIDLATLADHLVGVA